MGNNAAIVDILNNPRYQGAMESIKPVTQFIDTFFIMFVSLCAFFIISSALMRNVIAGVYASNPQFFDKVNEVKMSAADKVRGKGPRGVGTIAAFILNLIPDFKELSDFKDNNVQPRDYFMKAIPQMFAVIMIGVAIYNGYHRDVTVKVAYLGSEIINRVIINTDPVEMWDKLTNSVGTPESLKSGAETPKGKYVDSVSKDLYSRTVSFYTDIQTVEAKNKLATTIRNKVTSITQQLGDEYFDEDKWKASYNVIRTFGSSDISAASTDPESKFIKQFEIPVSELQLDSGKYVGKDYRYVITCTFNRVYKGTTSIGSGTVTMIAGNNLVQGTNRTGVEPFFTIKLNQPGMWTVSGTTTVSVDGESFPVTKVDGNLKITGTTQDLLKSATATVQGLSYRDTRGNTQSVRGLKLSSGSGISFEYEKPNGGGTGTFKEGDAPPDLER